MPKVHVRLDLRANLWRLCFAIFGAVLFLAPSLSAATYTVGGAGANYATLEALRASGVLQDGDIVILSNIDDNDNSLTRTFATTTLTLRGTGNILGTGNNIHIFTSDTKNLTFDSSSLQFSGFRAGAGTNGAVVVANTVTFSGGTNTFFNNEAGHTGGVIFASEAIINGGTNVFRDNRSNDTGGAIWVSREILVTGGTNTFTSNNAMGGGAFRNQQGTIGITGGTNTFAGNTARTTNGGAVSSVNISVSGGTNTFSNNTAAIGYGGALWANTTISIANGENMFSDNSANYGGAIFAGTIHNQTGTSGRVTIAEGINTFAGNTATGGDGGAIYAQNDVIISGGTNTFTDNRALARSGAAIFSFGEVSITDGINTFDGNSVAARGAAIWGGLGRAINISGGINTFSDNTAEAIDLDTQHDGDGGAAIFAANQGINITGGTNTFERNSGYRTGGAIHSNGNSVFRATDGDFVFRENRDLVTDTSVGKANSIHHTANTLTLAARAGQNVYFYDPITTSTSTTRTININNLDTDRGRVVFDGSLYSRDLDRHSAIYGNTTVNYGELALKGQAIYGAANNTGTFTLNRNATLSSDATVNRVQAA
ncbi:MAG: hypothetical protein FWE95_04980, partial [Planctomycetaceae bacterium]|nr:hypothetical protein [Planctomycetaceae bacterium]